ncbi:MAG: HAD family hydrolase [Candidatus Rokuibacteriota bacterium]
MKLVLFDVDGTLISARGAGRRAMRVAFERVFGTAGGIDRYDLRGRTDTRIVHDVMSAEGWEPARVKERLDEFFEVYVGGLTTEIGDGRNVITLPGVAAVVERLERSGEAVLGLVTGNIEEGARVKLLPTGLWPRFQVGAFGSDHMDRRRLPSLAARRAYALRGTAFSPRDVLVIGDTPHDIDCARAFGAVAVAVATGQHSRDELLAESPDLFFDDLADVEKVLAALLGG